MRRAFSSLIWTTLIILLLGCCMGFPSEASSEWSTAAERRTRREWEDGGGGGRRYALGDALLRSGAFYGAFYGMYGAAVGGRGALLGWESVPGGASSADFGSSYKGDDFYGVEASSEEGHRPTPPPPPPPPPPILSQLSSVYFTAALVDFDGRDLAGDPQQFEEFRDLYLDAIGRIPQLLNLQSFEGTVIHRVMLLDGVVPNIDTEMQFSDANEAQTFARVLQGLGGTNELGFGAVQFKYVSLNAPAWPPPDQRLSDSSPPPSPMKPPSPPPPTTRPTPSPQDRPLTTPPASIPTPTFASTVTAQPTRGTETTYQAAGREANRMESQSGDEGVPQDGVLSGEGAAVGFVSGGQSSAWGDCALDRFGGCCTPPAVLDAKKECCESGVVDECGVCGGLGSTCAVVANVTVGLSTALEIGSSLGLDRTLTAFKQSMNRLFKDYQLDAFEQLEVEHIVDRHSKLNATRLLSLTFIIHPMEDAGQSSPAVTLPSRAVIMERLVSACAEKYTWRELTLIAYEGGWRTGVCGNGLCEVGEMGGGCLKDCPPEIPCPQPTHVAVGTAGVACAGRGACASASGTCICHDGHTGRFCEVCADGYVAVGERCVPAVELADSDGRTSPRSGNIGNSQVGASSTPIRSSAPPGPSHIADDTDSPSSREPGLGDAGLIIGIVVGAFTGVTLGMVAVAGAAYWVLTRKERSQGDHELAERGVLQEPPPPDVPPSQAAFTAAPWPPSPAHHPPYQQELLPEGDAVHRAVTSRSAIGPGGGGWGGLSGRRQQDSRQLGMAQLYATGTWPDVPLPTAQRRASETPARSSSPVEALPTDCVESSVVDEMNRAADKGVVTTVDDDDGGIVDQRSEGRAVEEASDWTGCFPGTSRRKASAATRVTRKAARDRPSTVKAPRRVSTVAQTDTQSTEAAASIDAATATEDEPASTAVATQTQPPSTERFTIVENPIAAVASEEASPGDGVGSRGKAVCAGTQTTSQSTVATNTDEADVSATGNANNPSRRTPSASVSRKLTPLELEKATMRGASVQTEPPEFDGGGAIQSSVEPTSSSCIPVSRSVGPARGVNNSQTELEPSSTVVEAPAGGQRLTNDFGVCIEPTWRDGELCIRPSGKQQAPVTINVTLHHHSHSGAHYHYQGDVDEPMAAHQSLSSSSSLGRQRRTLQQPGWSSANGNGSHKHARQG